MGLREYAAMWRHWADHPPLPLMVAGYLGIKPRPKPGANQDAAVMELMSMFGVQLGANGGSAVLR
jgi:hypothetical protein